MIGTTVGSYKIIERLGAGGMGEVYLAEHLLIDRRAAIKFLLPELTHHAEAVDRFFKEARATSLIRHPAIVEVFDCAVHESGRAYLVMELLDGETLAARLAREPELGLRDPSAALDIVYEVANALGAAHGRGIIHRDLKPDNIFLVRAPALRHGWRIKVLDFGIAKLLAPRGAAEPPSPSHTRADRFLGTPEYMSPEQCRDAGAVDHRTDIYSLGCILFELLSGRTPFVGPSFGQLVTAHLFERPPTLTELRPGIPASLSSLVARLLAKEPWARPATMGQVRGEITVVKAELGWTEAESEPRPETATLPSLQAIPAPSERGRGRWWSIVGVSSLGGLLATGAAWKVQVLQPGHHAAAAGRDVAIAMKIAAPPRPLPETVVVQVADPPAGLEVTVDGRPAGLPLTLPAGSDVHAVMFRAAGYADLAMALDGRASRRLSLGMHPAPATPPPLKIGESLQTDNLPYRRPAPRRQLVTEPLPPRRGPEPMRRPLTPTLTDEERKL